ncbi:bifunctional adenosylcobinamide kinase/adenosylcobinamide-phosphate guanylyltransferase [Coprococcus comes]|uniref:bifunctional adenosylcobinamide kinase/adenosylcobinamide-phosphate guanylyltransferase n=1 Tax=Coprococcus comes TaxID=410072 RepID=UPI001B3C9C59|nr:bifunctional adenosylcobinamide kinase/adenosylcobinamide-phosphate guanylyltransferase [Coprococcus comes]
MFHLITGGSGSGKSEYAEQKLMEYASHSKRNKKRYYIATMIPFGKETEEKIARHRKLRAGKGFETIECYTDLKKAAEILQTKETGSVLLECMSNLVANEMYDPSGAGENAEESILAGIHKLQKVSDDLVVVTNEVFSDSMTDNPEMEEYLKLFGKLNLRMGEMADLVTEVVYGIPVERKDIKK